MRYQFIQWPSSGLLLSSFLMNKPMHHDMKPGLPKTLAFLEIDKGFSCPATTLHPENPLFCGPPATAKGPSKNILCACRAVETYPKKNSLEISQSHRKGTSLNQEKAMQHVLPIDLPHAKPRRKRQRCRSTFPWLAGTSRSIRAVEESKIRYCAGCGGGC